MSSEGYKTVRLLGRGNYGEAWLVKSKRDRKKYVLKRVDLRSAADKERTAAEQEAKLLSQLHHPNIVTYKDSFNTPKGYLCIIMAFCEGGDLHTRLQQQQQNGTVLDEVQVIEWFVQVAMALKYLHDRCILHRDLKTQNIFLTKSGIIKVGDLGIARVLESPSSMATTMIGTPYYMSPEIFSYTPYSYKSDIWALGCCLYEMMTLKHAFDAKNFNSLSLKILMGKLPLMPKNFSGDLLDLARKMLRKSPDDRPTVEQILCLPFIRKNILLFINKTSAKQKASLSDDRSEKSDGSSPLIDCPVVPSQTRPETTGQAEVLGSSETLKIALAVSPVLENSATLTNSSRNTNEVLSRSIPGPDHGLNSSDKMTSEVMVQSSSCSDRSTENRNEVKKKKVPTATLR